MEYFEILILEDDPNVQDTYTRAIESYNKGNEDLNFNATFKSDKDEAIELLFDETKNIDGAIIDLDLKGSGGQDKSGNDVIRRIKDKLRFPVFVISGTTHNLAADLNSPSDFFKIVNRDDADFDFIDEFVSIHNTGITKLLNRNGKIENLISSIFWSHLSNSINIWAKDESRSPEQKEKSLLRYTLLHIQEYLDLNSSGTSEKYHPAEFFITKPVKPNIYTGDILQTNEGIRCVILTPACDIEKRSDGSRKADKILTLRIIDLGELDPEYNNPKMSNGKENKLKPYLNNSKPRYHYIPDAGDIKRGVIDFQDKFSIDDNKLEERIANKNVTRIATISSPFLKDVISRYSNYYARQGSPDFEVNELLNTIKKED